MLALRDATLPAATEQAAARGEDPVAQVVPAVSVRVYRPAPALQSYVTFTHVVDVAGPLSDFLYPEWGNVRFAVSGEWHITMPRRRDATPQGGALFGPTDRHSRVDTTGGRTVGFGLTPIGWARLVGTPACASANRIHPLSDLLGREVGGLDARLRGLNDDAAIVAAVEGALAARFAETTPPRPELLEVDRVLRTDPPTVTAFAERVGVTPIRLRHLCLELFGFPTKRMIRLQRFLSVLGHVRSAVGEPLAPAIAGSYFDAPHFHRDFRDFMAMSARRYFSAPRPLMAEAAAAQIRGGVTLSFELPPTPET